MIRYGCGACIIHLFTAERMPDGAPVHLTVHRSQSMQESELNRYVLNEGERGVNSGRLIGDTLQRNSAMLPNQGTACLNVLFRIGC